MIRAQAFNPTTVKHHFETLQDILDNNGKPIPASNLYNFDEVGIQLGGGRKGSPEKFFYGTTDSSKYRVKSDDLQLITVLETSCLEAKNNTPPAFGGQAAGA